MFLVKIVRLGLMATVFITAYLPISINPKIFERNQGGSVSYILENNNIVRAIDY